MKETKNLTTSEPTQTSAPANNGARGLLRHLHGPLESAKQIRYFDVKEMGYVRSPRQLMVGQTPSGKVSHEAIELLDADSRKPCTFCFLYSYTVQMGIILNVPFEVVLDELVA